MLAETVSAVATDRGIVSFSARTEQCSAVATDHGIVSFSARTTLVLTLSADYRCTTFKCYLETAETVTDTVESVTLGRSCHLFWK